MLRRFGTERISVFDEPINRVLEEMKTTPVDSEEYSTMLEHLSKLNELKAQEKPKRVSRDTIVMAGSSLLGIIVIVAYEHAHVVTSKALTLLPKTKHP